MVVSNLSLLEAINKIVKEFAPIKLYHDNNLLWDDEIDCVDIIDFIDLFKMTKDAIKIVNRIEIEIVHFHHSIVKFYSDDKK